MSSCDILVGMYDDCTKNPAAAGDKSEFNKIVLIQFHYLFQINKFYEIKLDLNEGGGGSSWTFFRFCLLFLIEEIDTFQLVFVP